MESINEKIKRLRIESGVSKAEMARAAGLKQSSYSSIENGDTKSITIEVGKGIAKALDISFIELFDISILDKYFEGYKADLISIQQAYDDLDSTVKELLERIKEKDLLIEALKNEKAHIKEHLVMQMVTDTSFEIGFVKDQISKTKDESEIQRLIQKKEDIIRSFNRNKEYYIKTGFLVESDIDDYIGELEGALEKELIKKRNDTNN